MAEPPPTFTHFYEAVKRLIEPRSGAALDRQGKLAALPPSPNELARRAEDTREFGEVVPDLIASTEFGPERDLASELLKRSGFYHCILAAVSEAELWSRLYGHTKPRTAQINTLLLLDGCAFPRDRFDLLGNVVIRHSVAEIADLGPPPEVAEAFFPNETLDTDWFSRQWFLRDEESIDRDCRSISYGVMNRRIGERSGDTELNRCWPQLLALGLYDLTCFAIPIILKSEAKWNLYRLRFSRPGIQTWGYDEEGNPIPGPTDDYCVTDDDWSQFEAFLKLCKESITPKQEWSSIRIAARHYLRATFCCGPDGDAHTREDREDTLLHYIYGLESLLLAGDREAITDKIATRAALVAGEDDNERGRIHDFVKEAYRARSGLVHGREASNDIDLRRLRDVFRRVMVAILAVARRCEEPKELKDMTRKLPIARDTQDDIARNQNEVFPLIKATESRQ